MLNPTPLPMEWLPSGHDAEAEAIALSEKLRHMVALARGLTGAGRQVDVAGLDGMVGLLCAKALDLPADRGRATRPVLAAILAELDALSVAMRANTR